MNDFWNKYNRRARVEGHLKTWLYLLGNFVLPKLKVQIKYLFLNEEHTEKEIGNDVQLVILDSFSQLKKEDIHNLLTFEGEALVETFRNEFLQGNRCAVGRREGLVSACWIAKAPSYLQDASTNTYIIRDCFTLPSVRGMGIYPMIIDFIVRKLQGESPGVITQVAINSVVTNHSSIRGILKSGFSKAGLIFQIGNRGLVIYKNHNKRIIRFI